MLMSIRHRPPQTNSAPSPAVNPLRGRTLRVLDCQVGGAEIAGRSAGRVRRAWAAQAASLSAARPSRMQRLTFVWVQSRRSAISL